MHKGTEQILKQRYLWEWSFDESKIQETVDMMLLRVAKKVASAYLNIKKDYKKVRELAHDFYSIMKSGKFIPSSPQLFNVMRGFGNGKEHYDIIYKDIDKMTNEEWDTMNQFRNPKAAYGSCYAMGRIGDSIDEIYDALKEQAVIFKSAGGYGVSFSDLRSEGSLVSTTMGESCGPLGFMDLFNINTQKIALSGKTKRGANMFSMSVSHPDIEKFIMRKSEMIEDENGQIRPKYLEHVNISVEITDDFMAAVENGDEWNLIDPHTKEVVKTIDAQDLWDMIIDSVYKSADPGLLMLDNINRFNPLKHIRQIRSVNPCVTGDTLVPTNKGLIRADELKEGMLTWNPIKKQMDKITKVFNNGLKDIYKVIATYDIGKVNTLVATAEHKLMRVRFDENEHKKETLEMISISELKPGDLVKVVFSRADGQPYEAFTGLNAAYEGYAKIVLIEHVGQDVVYDITVPDDYMWVTNGFVSLDCSEYQGYDKTVCNLGSINLYALLRKDIIEKNGVFLDYYALETTIERAVIYLNLALMANDYPLEVLTQRSLDYRPIGLGFMGLASVFMRMGYEYGSKESIEFTKGFIDEFVYYTIKASNKFYHMSGIKFKDYDKSDYAKGNFYFTSRDYNAEISDLLKDGVTNSRLIAIAPTGSISMIAAYLTSDAASVSGGIEPVFSLNYTRKVNPNTDQEFVIDQDDIGVRDTLKAMGYNDDTIRQVMDGDPKAKHIVSDPRFKTADKLSVDQHLSILEIVSNAIDMSVSKTINLPEDATREEISELYKKAYKLGLKGITIFRAGSRQAVLEAKKKTKKQLNFDLGISINDKGKITPKERPTIIQALKKSVKFKATDDDITRIMNIEVGFDEKNDPFEVFIRATTTTKDYAELFNAIGRLVSTSLRSNADIKDILKQVKKIKNWKNDYSYICQIISSAVEELVELGKTKSRKKQQEAMDKINKANLITSPKGYLIDPETGEAYCPVCMAKQGEGLKFESGCINCACGWSACA